jgi:hypothetical protein
MNDVSDRPKFNTLQSLGKTSISNVGISASFSIDDKPVAYTLIGNENLRILVPNFDLKPFEQACSFYDTEAKAIVEYLNETLLDPSDWSNRVELTDEVESVRTRRSLSRSISVSERS